MKILKTTLAAVIALGFLAAGCASKATEPTAAVVKETKVKHHSYSSKLGTESTKKDTKK